MESQEGQERGGEMSALPDGWHMCACGKATRQPKCRACERGAATLATHEAKKPPVAPATRYHEGKEKLLQLLCEAELSLRGCRVIHHLSNRARESAGYPDITACLEGIPIACELKVKGNTTSADQEATLAAMRLDGWNVRVCWSFDDFREWLDGLQNDQEYARIIELETAITKAVSNLRHHHMRRGGISVIADALEKAQKGHTEP